MTCESDGAPNICRKSQVNIQGAGICMELHCSSPIIPFYYAKEACFGLQIHYPDGQGDRQCHCTGNETLCSSIANPLDCPFTDAVDPCGSDICNEASGCCDSPSAPDCSNCGCTPVADRSTESSIKGFSGWAANRCPMALYCQMLSPMAHQTPIFTMDSDLQLVLTVSVYKSKAFWLRSSFFSYFFDSCISPIEWFP